MAQVMRFAATTGFPHLQTLVRSERVAASDGKLHQPQTLSPCIVNFNHYNNDSMNSGFPSLSNLSIWIYQYIDRTRIDLT